MAIYIQYSDIHIWEMPMAYLMHLSCIILTILAEICQMDTILMKYNYSWTPEWEVFVSSTYVHNVWTIHPMCPTWQNCVISSVPPDLVQTFYFKRNRITNKHKAYEWLSRLPPDFPPVWWETMMTDRRRDISSMIMKSWLHD